jgi:phytoene/squalene synthetase
VCREVDRLEDVNMDRRALGVEDQGWEAEARTPARIYEHPVDEALQPAAFESIELMIVWATWSQRSVRG